MAYVPKKKHRSSLSTPNIFSVRVELLDVKPVVWRELILDGRTRLAALHHIIQAAMGWTDAHLHEFEIREQLYGELKPEIPDFDHASKPRLDERKFRLNQLLTIGDTFLYRYDYGDNWQHQVTVIDIDDGGDPAHADGLVLITAGGQACPPEDAGGSSGYQNMLTTWEAAPYGQAAKEIQEWAGLDFDPDRFDRHAANAAIQRLIWNRWIKIGS
ncbi:MAG: plasmid pRiA4b ORF-3 family protein [Pseudomonadota bacterium]|nr:plasmid pRiA4b ORF-3 family protein [Pseudomonadota bacterium]